MLFDTTMGRLQCQLFDKESPVTVANFVGLATGTKPYLDPTTGKQIAGKHFYDKTTFHRVIPEFMIQGGDPLGTGEGGPGYQFQNESSPALRFDVPGRLAMANAGPDTNGSQFFITELPHPELNGGYTIFGQCDDHTVNLVATIARVERNANDKPLTDVVVNKVTVIPAGQPVPPAPAVPGAVPTIRRLRLLRQHRKRTKKLPRGKRSPGHVRFRTAAHPMQTQHQVRRQHGNDSSIQDIARHHQGKAF